MRKYVQAVIFCGVIVLLTCSNAFAEEKLITAEDTDVILDLAKGYGSANLSTDKDGDPLIEGKIGGLVYNIFFYGCKKGKDCESLQFETGWGGNVKAVSLDEINEWNRRKLFVHSMLNKDGQVRLHMEILLRFGVSRKNLDADFDVWRSLIHEFNATVMSKIQ